MRRPLPILAALAVLAALVIGIVQTSGSDDPVPEPAAPSGATAAAELRGAPPALAAVHRQANQLLPVEEFEDRLRELRGHPVVVNVWGSWCTPCREEFPIFASAALRTGKRVAFLGLATQDSREAAGAFLKDSPVSYPSYLDFQGEAATKLGVIGAPATIFYDAQGRRTYFHNGKYETEADLLADVERYTGA
jgi:thiol-disulfide isomerase/thioredoxin